MVDNWIFCGLNKSLNRQRFDCGVAELNEYLQRYASQNHRKGIATSTNVFIYSLGNNRQVNRLRINKKQK